MFSRFERSNYSCLVAAKGNYDSQDSIKAALANIGLSLLAIDYIEPYVERIVQQHFLGFFRGYTVLSKMQNVRIVPFEQFVIHSLTFRDYALNVATL
jgi:hypothetical protein